MCGGPLQVVLLCCLPYLAHRSSFFFLPSQTFLLFADLSPFLLSTSFNCCCCIHLFSESINANQIRSFLFLSQFLCTLFLLLSRKWLLGKFTHFLFIKFIWARNLLKFSKLLFFFKDFSHFYVPSKNQPFTIFNRKLAIDKLPLYFNY